MRGARILLCEDDRETRWALATVLRQEGAKVHEAQNGDEGLGFLRRGPYDLVVSDVSMPGMGGFGLFAALRFGEGEQLAAHRGIPIMLVSGRASRGEMARALDAGVDEFMAKPLDPFEFKARVRNLMRRTRQSGATARTSGDMRDFGMRSLAQALHTAGRTARLVVQAEERNAMLDFVGGKLVHAIIEAPGVELKGEAAAVEALALEEGSFQIQPLPEAFPRNVFTDTPALILKACARMDETASSTADFGSREIDLDAFRNSLHEPRSRSATVFDPGPPTGALPLLEPEQTGPVTGRVYANDGAGTQEVDLEQLLGEVRETLAMESSAADERAAEPASALGAESDEAADADAAPGDEPDAAAEPESAEAAEPDAAAPEAAESGSESDDTETETEGPALTEGHFAFERRANEQKTSDPVLPPKVGSVLETALAAGAFDDDDYDDEDDEYQREDPYFDTADVLGSRGIDPCELLGNEDAEERLSITEDLSADEVPA